MKDIQRQAGVKITVPKNIPDLPVTMKVADVHVEDALEVMIQSLSASLPNLQYKAIGEEYQLLLAQPNQ